MSELQHVVDSLARITNRAVSVQDHARRLLAHSSQLGGVDEIRTELILTRRGPEKGFAWARTFGIETSEEPVRIPANQDLGMEARVATAIRFDGRLLGYLWLVDPDESLPDEDLSRVKAAADAVALAIRQEELMEQRDSGRRRELLRDLLSDEGDVRLHAVDSLIETGLLIPSDLVVAYVIRLVRDRTGMQSGDTAIRNRLERVLEQARQPASRHQHLHLVRPDHGILLVTCTERSADNLHLLGEELRSAMSAELPEDEAWQVVVGIGEPQPSLADGHVSYQQARKAAGVAGLLDILGAVARWADLGVYQTLVQLPLSEVTVQSLHPALIKLFESNESKVWLETLECFLDMAGAARPTAEKLWISRGSLYHRIHRIEEMTGISLGNGETRLALHLDLKLARLAGLLDSPETHVTGADAS